MSGPGPGLRHLLVAFDLSAHSLAALEAAAALAARTGGDLLGLYVEDEDFLRLADLPAARFVDARSAAVRPHDVATMERELRHLAEGARRAIEETARRARVRWSFRVVRGPVPPCVLAEAAHADLVALGRTGHEGHAGRPLGSTARTLVAYAPASVLLLRRGERVAPPILVAYDGTDVADRALDLAGRLRGKDPLCVLLAAERPDEATALRARAEEALPAPGSAVRFRGVAPRDLVAAVRGEHAGLLLLPAAPGSALVGRLDEIPCPVLLVR